MIQSSDQISAFDIFRSVLNRWKFFTIIVLACGVLGFGVSLTLKPMYRAQILFAVKTPNETGSSLSRVAGRLPGVGQLLGGSLGLGGSDLKQQVVARLSSFQLLDAYVDEFEVLPDLFSKYWDKQKQDWKPEPSGFFSFLEKGGEPSDWAAVHRLRERFVVVEDASSSLITLYAEWEDAQAAADAANRLISYLDQRLREQAIAQSDRRIDYLRGELNQERLEAVRNTISAVMEAEMKSKTIANADREFALEVLDPAVPPVQPYRPRRMFILAISLMIGVIVGTATTFVLEQRHKIG